MLITVIIISVLMVLVAFLGLGLNVIFRKNGKFPDTEIETNPKMRDLGINCARHEELEKHNERGKDTTPGNQSGMRDCGLGCSCASLES